MADFGNLKNQAELLLSKLTSGKQFMIGDLNNRLQTAADNHPQDTVIKAVASVIEKRYRSNPKDIISQGELDRLYQELVGLNVSGTRFREVLGDLLISEKEVKSNTNEQHIKGLRDGVNPAIEYNMDSQLKESFDYLFEPKSDTYNPKLAANAKDKVSIELRSLGFNNHRVRLAGGNSRFLVFAADLDTNRGAVRVFIPAEASGEKLPSVFVSGNRFSDLNSEALNEHLSGASLRNDRLPNVTAILNSLDAVTGALAKNANTEQFNSVVNLLPDANNSESLSSGNGVFTSVENEANDLLDVHIPNAPVPELLKPLASDIEESVVEAAVGYPQASVRLAKRMILAELSSMGFQGSQLRISDATQDGFICEAVLNTPKGKVGIEIPVEMKENVPLMPSVFAKEDYIADFNAENIHTFVKRDAGNYNLDVAVNRSGPLMGLSINELRDTIIRSATNGDFDTCDEVMEVIAQRFDEGTYRSMVASYHSMLSNLGSAKKNLKQALIDNDQFIKSPNSIYPIHKHLGRPAHELIRDENGTYHIKSTYYARKNQSEEGAFFSNAKVLVGD